MTRIKSEPEHLERGGGGRRKQSKPIRVFLSDEDLANQPSKMVESLEQTENNSRSNSDGLIEDMPRSECEMEVEEDLMSCDLCDESFTTQTSLMEHVQTAHTATDENAQHSFPTKYHQLGSQFQSGNLPSLPEDGAVPQEKQQQQQQQQQQQPPQRNTEIVAEKNSDSQGVPCNGSKARIFHKDAYCELCDREFCNKYFLKTHRANKHGIYEDDSPPSSVGALLQPTTPTSHEPLELQLNRQLNGSPFSRSNMLPAMPKPLQEPVPQALAPMLVPTSHPPASPPKSSMSALSTPTKHMSMPRPVPTSTGKPTPDMEDYCEMCQKHFCNKYYLKKHKQDVHGIIPESSPSTAGKRGRPPMSGQISGLPMGNGHLPNNSLPNLVMPPSSGSVSNGSANIPGLGNVMLINPFAPQMLLQAPQVLGGLPAGFPQQMGVMPQMPQQGSVASESPKSTSTTSTTSVSSANVPLNNDALRGMGVLNAEAYCELCRKEFCNKYFLRIHKANKHGILIEDPDQPLPANIGGLPVLNVPNLPNAGDLPPGTINITPTSEAESQGKPEEGKMERSPVGGDKEVERGEIRQHAASEEVCSLCKKEFANKYSLKVHMINAHGITVPDFDLLPPKDNKMKLDGQSPLQGGSMFGNMMAAKLADRVMCDICNKEVCNKYFLKTHKIKVHGLDPILAEKELNAMSSGLNQPGKMNMPTGQSPLKMMNKPIGPPSRSPPNEVNNENNVPRPKDEDLLKMGIDPEAYCEICKKEFCSKYFLKTHKQNIHGIKSDMGIGMMSAQQVPLNPMIPLSSSMNFNPSESPKIHYSNNNNKTGLSGNNSPVSQTGSDSSNKDAHSRVACDICNKEVCNKYFLKTHMLNKHGINTDLPGHFPPFMPGLPFPMHLPDQGPMDMPLNMFSSNFMARLHEEMSQPLDLKKPITPSSLHVESKKAGENGLKEMMPSAWHVPAKKEDMQLSLQKCEICGLMFGEKVTLQLHMIQDHPGQVTVSTKTNTSEEKPSHLGGNIVLSLKKKYQKGRRIRGHIRKLFSNNSSSQFGGEQQQGKKKKFRCAYCQLRFVSKLDCQAHIRKNHPKAKTEGASTSPTSQQNMLSSPLPNGVDKNCKMQAFQMFCAERQEQFAPATVYLPVYEKVDQPLTMTFNLKPKPMEL